MKKSDIVKQYLSLNEGMPDLTLAKIIFDEKPGLFKSVDAARGMVRYYTSHCGEANRHEESSEFHKPLNYNTKTQSVRVIDTSAKILIVDIETAPILAYVWSIWQQNVQLNQIESDWYCLTWAAKWLFEEKVYSGKLTPKEARKQDDKRIVKGIWELINQADVVIAHNGDKFDMPKLNTRFIVNGLHPPLPYQSIDTLKHIKRQFGFSSNRLDYVNQILSLPRKMEHDGMPLWIGCMKGEADCLKKMEEYNVQDVLILEDTYLKIRPWIKPHPNVGLFILDENQHRCPTCGSDDMKDEGKRYHTTVNAYDLMRCNNCGATSRKRVSAITIKERRHILSSTPK